MTTIKDNQEGFSPIEIILIVIIVLAIGAISYYVYSANKNIDSTYKSATNIANAPAPKFSKIKTSTTTSTTSSSTSTAK